MMDGLAKLATSELLGYIGPGAGFALAGSFLALFGALFSALVMIVFWPLRRLMRLFFRRRPPGRSRFKRVVILGLDGLDYRLTQRLLSEGRLPHLARLRARGGFAPLASTLPPISPVAWSTFQTGVNPGKHNIFDFLTPDPATYEPKLSSVEIRSGVRRIGIGPLRWTWRRPDIRLLRKSRPFWSLLGEFGIFSCVQRVPITFPPEKFRGVQLSAMCVPDLRGTQGTFSLYTTQPRGEGVKTGGDVHVVRRQGDGIACELTGPPHPSQTGHLKLPFTVTIRGADSAVLEIGRDRHALKLGVYSGWVAVRFRVSRTSSVQGLCRFLLLGTAPEFELYVTPIQIDPERPAMPIGYPAVYPIYLARRQGPFATLGLAEDTWGLSEEVLSDAEFARQCADIDREREAMFFDGLDKVSRGLCVCVFDSPDRMQHMFWRYHDPAHPARPACVPPAFATAVEDLYVRMDQLVGRVMRRCDDERTLLMVLSDHGFNTFRRGVDLNRWLEDNGYLVVDDAARDRDYLAGVDWSQTRAFALGLAGIYINRSDRFERGTVDTEAEAQRLAGEIAQRLSELVDPQTGNQAILRSYRAAAAYRGPYKDRAPDVLVGYAEGYRVSWDAAVGRTSRRVFHDNRKAWSGDHCVDPSVVPGVLFCNHEILEPAPRLVDLAPTVLQQFGCPVPEYMDGRPIALGPRNKSQPAEASREAVQMA